MNKNDTYLWYKDKCLEYGYYYVKEQSGSYRFSAKFHDFTRLWQFTAFPIPDMVFSLLKRSYAQLENCKLPPWCVCHYCGLGFIMSCWTLWVIGIIAGEDYWLFSCLEIFNGNSGMSQRGDVGSDPSQGLWVLCLKCMVPLAIATYLLSQGKQQQPINFGSHMDNPDQQIK